MVGVNTSVSVCGPAESVSVVVATPLAFTATGLPIGVAPSENCTVPPGNVPSYPSTVAVRVIGLVVLAGLGDAVSVFKVGMATAGLTSNQVPIAGSISIASSQY